MGDTMAVREEGKRRDESSGDCLYWEEYLLQAPRFRFEVAADRHASGVSKGPKRPRRPTR